MQKRKYKSKAWFLRRVGKRIFRDDIKCCDYCKKRARYGVVVSNEQHADYLANIDRDYASEGIYLNYRDEK